MGPDPASGGESEGPASADDGLPQRQATGSEPLQVICVVPGCDAVLQPRPNDRSQRQKVCSDHQSADTVQLQPGVDCRFCQRCARFQPVEWFQGSKRSCEASLAAHNLRRRRSRAEQKLNDDVSSIPSGFPEMKCIVDGCNEVLDPRQYMQRRYKACVGHQRALSVVVDGVKQRFCQQCSRFQPVGDFDDDKHSCRTRLASHNARRRKQPRLTNEDGDHLASQTSPSSSRPHRRSSQSAGAELPAGDRGSSPPVHGATSSPRKANTYMASSFMQISSHGQSRRGTDAERRFSTMSDDSASLTLGTGIGGQLARLSSEFLHSSADRPYSLSWDDCNPPAADAAAPYPASMDRPAFPMFPPDAYFRSRLPTFPSGPIPPSAGLTSSPRFAGHPHVAQTASFLRQQEAQAIAQAALEYNYLLSGTSNSGPFQVPPTAWAPTGPGQRGATADVAPARWEAFALGGRASHYHAAEAHVADRGDLNPRHHGSEIGPAAARSPAGRQEGRIKSPDSSPPPASRRNYGASGARSVR